MGMITTEIYSTPDAAAITGATYRQLDEWDRTGSFPASVRARGSGTQRGYTLHDLVLASILVDMSALGLTAGPKARIVNRFRQWFPDLDTLPDEVWIGLDGFVYRTAPAHGLTFVLCRPARHRDAIMLTIATRT